ncbi:hypothetical protein FRC17_001921 [Serendipita sp. 399]|nr:hypothetical protein FRC17_001921 [Serendipita sp. 399]
MPSPNALPPAQWSPSAQSYPQKTTPGATISPQPQPGRPLPTVQAPTGSSNSKLHGAFSPANADGKSQTIFDKLGRLITTHQTMEERTAPQNRDVHIAWAQDRMGPPADAEYWPDDGPGSPTESEESDFWSGPSESRPDSSSILYNYGHSTPNVQQTAESFSNLQIRSQRPLLTASSSTAPSVEAENENEDEDGVPDLTGSVRLLSRIPVFSGTYSSVYQGTWQGHHVAVKMIRAVGSLKATRRKFRREAKVWSRLSHPNILLLYGLCMDEDFGAFGALISPKWCKNGNSAECVREIEDPAKRIRLYIGVANGVRYLHEHTLIHGDLKPANILIDDDGSARLCDFGLARLMQEHDTGMTTTTAHTGTVRYLAQELVVADNAKPTTETDCHALGCIGLEVP